MTQDQLLAGLKKDVRSLLISAKRGLTPEQLKRDYQTMLGFPIPLRLLGFRNVLDMVKEMPDVVHLDYHFDGSIILKAIGDESTKGIEELVSKQRDHKPKPKVNNRRGNLVNFHTSFPRHQPVILPRRGPAKPALPAQLRSQLKQLLSHGPVRLSELEYRYTVQFGKPLQITQYGFYSISEMLAAATDFIIMQQSRTGSQLLLKSSLVPLNQTENQMPRLSKKLAPPLVVKQKPVGFSPKATSPPKRDQQSSPLSPAVPKPEPVKKEHSFEETIFKLEEELRQQILEKGTAGSVSRELKDKLRKVRHICLKTQPFLSHILTLAYEIWILFQVVAENGNGISIHNLPTEYKRMYSEELPVSQCGFLSVTEMVGALSDTFSIQRGADESENHWMVVEFKPNDTQPSKSELSPGHGTTSSPTDESQNPSSKAYYLSYAESAWEREETEQSTDPQESDAELRVTNKTIHQMGDLFPELMVSHVTAVPPDAVRCQKLKSPNRRRERELVPVLVEQTESPSHFYIRFSQNKEARALENMMIEMRSCYSYPDVAERYRLTDAYVRPGQVCCVAPRDMWFYRVVIHEVFSNTEVKVYYVDFGDITKVERNSLRFLKACYADLPAQAVPAMLAGVRPITSIWTQSAISSFQRMCCERTLVAAIHSYQNNFLLLFLCDTNTEEDVYVHAALQKEGHALPCVTAYGLVSGQFNPLTSYLGDDQIDDVKESLTPSTCSPDIEIRSQGYGSPCSSQTGSSSENGQTNFSSIDVEPSLDLPALECINVPDVNTEAESEKVNPFEALQGKNPLCCSQWDQGWTAEDKTDKTKHEPDVKTEDESKPEIVSPPPVQETVSELQMCVSPAKPKPVSSTCTSPHTSDPIQINCIYPAVPVYPVQPPFSQFMKHFLSSPVPVGQGPHSPFWQHTSPLALTPAARMSAGANVLHRRSNHTV
ncbi:tudor domain-containing protein 5 isoform X3 [Rhinichthys klamathensis goyatoka]|uniref:tudor domain-containing protein 5 isoform X3 n=1 Tax=Rhinichthys klamathensis goyatoka TaxID=3034132 RepID=UPI0024B5DEDA|nr:tudor domain-containing protein 5 isoform X3 [Rhinichthys klamathensis goyatoka]